MDDAQPGPDPVAGDDEGAQASEAVDHLRAAAHELIGAVRGFLDLAEEFIDDPQAGDAVADTVASFAQAARRGARSAIHDAGGSPAGVDYETIDLDD